MSFSNTTAIVGTPEFGVIHINAQSVAEAFQKYLNSASKLTGVGLDDVNTSVMTLPPDPSTVTLTTLLDLGMKLFDAVVWLTAGRPATHPLVVDDGIKKEDIPSMHDIARSVFYCYFMLLTQARYPAGSDDKNPPNTPNFLKVIMGMDKPQHVYVSKICSFEPQKFDPKWAKWVSFAGFGQEVTSRFGLGVAGYRMFGPFKLYEPKPDLPANLRPAFDFARLIAKTPPSWDIHPLTRKAAVLSKRGNLNKNLGNLILDSFKMSDIEEMVKARILYAIPVREAAHRNYLTWTSEDDISEGAFIFAT